MRTGRSSPRNLAVPRAQLGIGRTLGTHSHRYWYAARPNTTDHSRPVLASESGHLAPALTIRTLQIASYICPSGGKTLGTNKCGSEVEISDMGDQSNVPADQFERQLLLETWKTCEEVAMHFNELLQGFRLKAIGAVSLGATITVGLKVLDSNEFSNHRIIAYFFFGLAAVWFLVAVLDFLYYHRLLAGSVDELLRVDKLGNVYLSHQIEHRVRNTYPASGSDTTTDLSFLYGTSSTGVVPSAPVWFFYVVPFAILILAGWFIGSGHCCATSL